MKFRTLVATCLALVGALPLMAKDKPSEQAFDEAEFVRKAASGGMLEVALGKVGQDMAKSADVKKFASQLVTDHTQANTELKAIASTAKIPIEETLMKEHQKHLDQFKDYKGNDFDSAYIDHMVKDHEEDIELFTKASTQAKNEQIKEFAKKTLPTLQSHLKMAKQLQAQK